MEPGGLLLVAEGLSFPTSVTFDADGVAYVAESGLSFGGAPPGGRVWRLLRNGGRELVADGLGSPVNGLTCWNDHLFVSEGNPGRISRLGFDGEQVVVLDGLPGPGNYHTNMATFGPDGKLYFSQGAMTNSGIVGLDAYELGWLRRLPHAHDLPGLDVVLTGVNVETADPLASEPDARATTGAFAPFGTPSLAGQRVSAALPCTAAVMRCNPDGTGLELVAWGLRNAYALGFLPDGRLLAVDQGVDDRGSRPMGNAPDLLYEIRSGAWYGWPDFVGGDPVTDPRYAPASGQPAEFLLANHDELFAPERPLLRFPPHSAAVKFDIAPEGWLAVALFGDEAPLTTRLGERRGRAVVRVDPVDWTLEPLIPTSLSRPIDVRFDRDGALWVLDFGRFEVTERGVVAEAGTGALYQRRPR